MRQLFFLFLLLSVSACTTSQEDPNQTPATPTIPYYRSVADGTAAYKKVAQRVAPTAKKLCLSENLDRPENFCDFKFVIISDDTQPPNAFQSVDRDGTPIVAFNTNMLRAVKNDHEIAFIVAHEAGHQIARHLLQKRRNATVGGLIGGIVLGSAGIDPTLGVELGSAVGARQYSQSFELEADKIGTYIAYKAGYNPVIGARIFERLSAENVNALSTHPASQARIDMVARTYAQIRQGGN